MTIITPCDLFKIGIDDLIYKDSYKYEEFCYLLDNNGYYGRYRFVDKIIRSKYEEGRFKALKVYVPNSCYEYEYKPCIDIQVGGFIIPKNDRKNKGIRIHDFEKVYRYLFGYQDLTHPLLISREIDVSISKIEKIREILRDYKFAVPNRLNGKIKFSDREEFLCNLFNFFKQ